jgi:type IV secretory pathway VirB3-like protein
VAKQAAVLEDPVLYTLGRGDFVNGPTVDVLVAGIAAIVAGILIVALRKPLLAVILWGQTLNFGERIGARMRATTRPRHLAAVGVFAMFLGAIFIVLAFVPGK